MAEIVPISEAMETALALLQAGDVVAVPTETVYGLAADATNGEAVARIFEAKGRPSFNPLIVHVASMEMADRLAHFDPLSRRLAEAFWPGPLTIVLAMKQGSPVHPLATAGLDTVGLRMPLGFAADLITRFGRPLAAPSANLSGRITATTAQAVAEQLGSRINLVVDGGATPVGVESTIVKVERDALRLLRPGGVTVEALQVLSGRAILRSGGKAIEAPGMMVSHYAPRAAMRLDASHVADGEALLAFGPARARDFGKAAAMRNLSPQGDLREAATNLFACLQALDASGSGVIAVEPIPDEGLGEAINDRLSRAAAPRSEGSE